MFPAAVRVKYSGGNFKKTNQQTIVTFKSLSKKKIKQFHFCLFFGFHFFFLGSALDNY